MKYIRFPDLVARGIVKSRMTLHRLIDGQGFPPGQLITPNCRAWSEDEVNQWLASRPVARKPTRAGVAARSTDGGAK